MKVVPRSEFRLPGRYGALMNVRKRCSSKVLTLARGLIKIADIEKTLKNNLKLENLLRENPR